MGEVCSEYYEKSDERLVPEENMADEQPFIKANTSLSRKVFGFREVGVQLLE